MTDRNDNSDDDEGFLQRWSRRKRDDEQTGLQKVAEPEVPDPLEPVAGRMITEPGILYPEPELLNPELADEFPLNDEAAQCETANVEPSTQTEDKPENLENIDFDALNFDSDYTRFMQAGVPEFVRRKALRKLWSSNPILANVDGLNDYDEDFTDAKLAVENLQTIFKAKHGYLTDEEVAAQERLGHEHELDDEELQDQEIAEAETAPDAETSDEPEAEIEPEADDEPVQTADSDDEDDDTIDDDGDSDWA